YRSPAPTGTIIRVCDFCLVTLAHNNHAMRIEQLTVSNHDGLVHPLVVVVVEVAEQGQLHVGVNRIVVQVGVNGNHVTWIGTVRTVGVIVGSDHVVFNKDDFLAAETLLRAVGDAVVHASDRLAVLIHHAVNVALESAARHVEGSPSLVSQRHFGEHLLLPGGPRADFGRAEGYNVVRRNSGVLGNAKGLAVAVAGNDGFVKSFHHGFDNQIPQGGLKAVQRYGVGKQGSGYFYLKPMVAKRDRVPGLHLLACTGTLANPLSFGFQGQDGNLHASLNAQFAHTVEYLSPDF